MLIDARNSAFIRACRGEPTSKTPVWFMRQAGRSFAEYRKLREKHSILDLCQRPELAAEVTMQPVKRLGVDAAILFSDIVVPLLAMGIDVDIEGGLGPVIDSPIRSEADIDMLAPLEPEAGVPHVIEAVKILVDELDVPLIGFGGAPFTLASYMIEGRPSKDHALTKAFMHAQPGAWRKLMDVLATSVLAYLRAQIAAGAAAVQLFDSWAGALNAKDYNTHVAPSVRTIFEGLASTGVPRIYFGVTTGEILPDMAAAGPDVMGVDWRVPLSAARTRMPPNITALQGNLDPALVLAPWEVLEAEARSVLESGGGSAHVFNLGHGVLPQTDPDVLARLVDFVHDWSP
ncbi:MAG: uroporphyrinogen decarboxylase [Actinomycetota bacterium]